MEPHSLPNTSPTPPSSPSRAKQFFQACREGIAAFWSYLKQMGSTRKIPAVAGDQRGKIAIGAGIGALSLCVVCSVCIGIASAISGTSPSSVASASHTASPAPHGSTTTARPTTKPATATPAPLGPPYVGGPYANFIHTYGQPFGQGGSDSENFYADSQQTIILNVRATNGTVTYLAVLGPESWSTDQTMTECIQFLPSGATAFNSIADLTDYHSSVGQIVIQNAGAGTCTVYTAIS